MQTGEGVLGLGKGSLVLGEVCVVRGFRHTGEGTPAMGDQGSGSG